MRKCFSAVMTMWIIWKWGKNLFGNFLKQEFDPAVMKWGEEYLQKSCQWPWHRNIDCPQVVSCFSKQYWTTLLKLDFSLILKSMVKWNFYSFLIIGSLFSYRCCKLPLYQRTILLVHYNVKNLDTFFWWDYLFCWKILPIYSVSRSFRKLHVKTMT